MDHCDECGFDYDPAAAEEAGEAIVEGVARLAALLEDRSPAERSLRWVAVHTLHEVHHHLLDVGRQVPPA